MKICWVVLVSLVSCVWTGVEVSAQKIALPDRVASAHPRIVEDHAYTQASMRARIAKDPEAQRAVADAKENLAPYMEHVRADPMWLASRLQMYWESHATDIYNRGDVFDHADGHAPVATVRFSGSRNPNTTYRAPRIEEIPAYEDDRKGVWLRNSVAADHPLEWANPAKSGRIIDGINASIVQLAERAAELYWLTGDEAYARLAFSVFDTYMQGMYYRKVPVDLLRGHSQTIYGMSTFEVIQEGNILPHLANIYDFLYGDLVAHHRQQLAVYADTFRKWIDVTLQNGVPFNNWNLFEDNIALSVALILDDDSAYADGHGARYYLDRIINEDNVRHWSIKTLAGRGYDPRTGIWFESPGYSMNVAADFMGLINRIDQAVGTDLLAELPVIRAAVKALPQYAFPNGVTVSWGDAHYASISSRAARLMVENARRHHRHEEELYFTAQARWMDEQAAALSANARQHPAPHKETLETLFGGDSVDLDAGIRALTSDEIFSAIFNAPSVSYLVQRNGVNPATGLMVAEAGSLGNHQHANGITMELYGLGLPLAPDSGIGTNYFEADHNEYYAQFPAHNTVVVDGVSSYPTMLSQHGFHVETAYPAAQSQMAHSASMTVTEVSFLEPETNAAQRRTMGTIRLSENQAYYIDIFHSHRRDGRDRMQDYFFHGLGQQMHLADGAGKLLTTAPTDLLTFAERSLGAYDYLWDKRQAEATAIYRAEYQLDIPDQTQRQLHVWMAGGEGRKLFAVKAPAARSLRDLVPAAIAELPLQTLVMRQSGEAWRRPFVSVFEPVWGDRSAAIQHVDLLPLKSAPEGAVAVQIEEKNQRRQIVVEMPDSGKLLDAGEIRCDGSYAVLDQSAEAASLLLVNGRWAETKDLHVNFATPSNSAYVRRSADDLLIDLSAPAVVEFPTTDSSIRLEWKGQQFKPTRLEHEGKQWLSFQLPALKQEHLRVVR